ncbi:hypothetical protein GF377_01310, partial [candidate division GN15 bacterium]|nr:hypothetical protein [candidate division GN15 bacterium]
GDANTLAATLATTVPLIIAVFRVYKHAIIRLGCVGLLALLLLMIVNTGSRSGLLTLMVVGGAMVWFSKYKFQALVVAAVVMVGGWFVLPGQYKERYMTLVDDDRDADEVSSGRIAIWENGLRMIAAKPLLGVGAGGFQVANNSGEFGPPIDMKPHSLYIQLFASYGFLGAAVWIAFLASIIRSQLRRRPDDEEEDTEDRESMLVDRGTWFDIMRRALFAMICGLMLSGVFGHSLFRYTWYLVAAMTICLVAIYFRTTPDTQRAKETGDDVEPDELADDTDALEEARA